MGLYSKPTVDTHSAYAIVMGSNLTLSGQYAIDGYVPGVGDRVFSLVQPVDGQSGLWLVQAGAWVRPPEFSDGTIIPPGFRIYVSGGSVNGGSVYTNSNNIPSVVGTATLIYWTSQPSFRNGLIQTPSGVAVAAADSSILVNASGVSVADVSAASIYNARLTDNYKDVCRLVATTEITSNTTPNGAAPNIVDGKAVAVGDRILVATTVWTIATGIWVVDSVGTGTNGVWSRAPDCNSASKIRTGIWTVVCEGAVYGGSAWSMYTTAPAGTYVIGTSLATWQDFTLDIDDRIRLDNIPLLNAQEFTVRSPLPVNTTGALTTSNAIHWVYVGYTNRAVTFRRIAFWQSANGSGTQTAGLVQVGVGTAEATPQFGTFPSIKCRGFYNFVTTNGVTETVNAGSAGQRYNSAPFSIPVPVKLHVYLGFRSQLTTQPTILPVFNANNSGLVLLSTATGAMVVSTVYATAAPAASVGQAPDLVGEYI